MRAQWVLLLFLECAAYFTSASLSRRGLRHGRGTVKERQEPYRAAPAQEPAYEVPAIGTTGNGPLTGLPSEQAPESVQNLQNYQVAMPTPAPATLNGVYCRGGACQYRVNPGPPTYAPPAMMTPPPLPIGGNMLAGREFCRGLACIKGMGLPVHPGLAPFTLNCVHLFNDVGGGMSGEDFHRNVAQVHDSFEKVCKRRVGVLEVGSCPAYANTFVGAVAVKVNSPTVGGTVEVCQDTFHWLQTFKQAEVDLKLTAAALPKGTSLLAGDLNRFGTGGVGPSSPRGLKWREYAWTHGKWPSPPAMPQQLASDGSFAGALLQTNSHATPPPPKPSLPGADSDENTPRGLPRYEQNTLPRDVAKPRVPISQTKYQIAPASADGAVPPVEVAGDLFDYCSQQFSEIMAGFSQTARVTVQMTKDWCNWQGSVSSWVGQKEEFGHPDWSSRTCSSMEGLVGFALREQLADTTEGLSAQQVCKNIFLAIGTVHRTEGLVKGAWESSLRGPPSSGIPAADDADMQMLLKDAQAYANRVFSRMRQQKVNFQKLNNMKTEMAAFKDTVQLNPPADPTPDLPSVNDFDPTALLALSVERVRQGNRVEASEVDQLKPWGLAV